MSFEWVPYIYHINVYNFDNKYAHHIKFCCIMENCNLTCQVPMIQVYVLNSISISVCLLVALFVLSYRCGIIRCTYLDRVKRIWYLSPMRATKVQASLHILAVSPEPSLLAHTSSGSRGTFRQKTRSLAPLNGWACAVEICHDGMLEDTNSLDGAHFMFIDNCVLPFREFVCLCEDTVDRSNILGAYVRQQTTNISSSVLMCHRVVFCNKQDNNWVLVKQ